MDATALCRGAAQAPPGGKYAFVLAQARGRDYNEELLETSVKEPQKDRSSPSIVLHATKLAFFFDGLVGGLKLMEFGAFPLRILQHRTTHFLTCQTLRRFSSQAKTGCRISRTCVKKRTGLALAEIHSAIVQASLRADTCARRIQQQTTATVDIVVSQRM